MVFTKQSASPTVLLAENNFLKKNNQDIVKALADMKNAYGKLEIDRNNLQKENNELIFENNSLYLRLKKNQEDAKNMIKNLLKCSDDATSIIMQSQIKTGTSSSGTIINSEPPATINYSMKTQAVKPMVSGLVIDRPFINLRRVPAEQLAANYSLENENNSNGQSNRENVDISTTLVNNPNRSLRLENSTDEFEHAQSSSEINSASNQRLETLLEDNENTTNLTQTANGVVVGSTSSNTPLLAGIFNDVRVYLTSPPNITLAASGSNSDTASTPSITPQNSDKSINRSSRLRTLLPRKNLSTISTKRFKRKNVSLKPHASLENSNSFNSSSQSSSISDVEPSTSAGRSNELSSQMRSEDVEPCTFPAERTNRFNSQSYSEDAEPSTSSSGRRNGFYSQASSGDVEPSTSTLIPQTHTNNKFDSIISNMSTIIAPGNESSGEVNDENFSVNDLFNLEKLNAMRELYLEPTHGKKIMETSTPYSPKKLRKRVNKLDDLSMTPKIKKAKIKKNNTPQMPSCKVVLKRINIPKRRSTSPVKRNSLGRNKKTTKSPIKRLSKSPNKKVFQKPTKSPNKKFSQSPTKKLSQIKTSPQSPTKNPTERLSPKSKNSENTEDSTKMGECSSSSPIVVKRPVGRPRRTTKPANLKEPSRKGKLRRS